MKAIRVGLLLGALAVLLVAVNLGLHWGANLHSVTLQWGPPPSTPGIVTVGYNVYRSTGTGSQYSRVATRVSAREFEDHEVRSRGTYFYVVTSIDQTGRESGYSAEVKAEVP